VRGKAIKARSRRVELKRRATDDFVGLITCRGAEEHKPDLRLSSGRTLCNCLASRASYWRERLGYRWSMVIRQYGRKIDGRRHEREQAYRRSTEKVPYGM